MKNNFKTNLPCNVVEFLMLNRFLFFITNAVLTDQLETALGPGFAVVGLGCISENDHRRAQGNGLGKIDLA